MRKTSFSLELQFVFAITQCNMLIIEYFIFFHYKLDVDYGKTKQLTIFRLLIHLTISEHTKNECILFHSRFYCIPCFFASFNLIKSLKYISKFIHFFTQNHAIGTERTTFVFSIIALHLKTF